VRTKNFPSRFENVDVMPGTLNAASLKSPAPWHRWRLPSRGRGGTAALLRLPSCKACRPARDVGGRSRLRGAGAAAPAGPAAGAWFVARRRPRQQSRRGLRRWQEDGSHAGGHACSHPSPVAELPRPETTALTARVALRTVELEAIMRHSGRRRPGADGLVVPPPQEAPSA